MSPRRARNRLLGARRFHSRQPAPTAASETDPGSPTPKDRRSLRSFLGLCNWLRDYVHRFADIAHPLTDLLSPKKPWRWAPTEEEGFRSVKEVLVQPLMLHRPNPKLPYVLQTNARGTGMAAVLYQEDRNRIPEYADHLHAEMTNAKIKFKEKMEKARTKSWDKFVENDLRKNPWSRLQAAHGKVYAKRNNQRLQHKRNHHARCKHHTAIHH
jgi:hypothetical protein